ncbi:MAG: MarR family transcriptional regulator [Chitinophagaceae bacterium]
MPAESIAQISLELGRALNEMRSMLRERIQARINDYDPELSFELLEVIGLLWRKDGITQQEIADHVSKDKSSMTYLINRLVKCKLVKRAEHETDKRHKRIYLTEKGKQVRKTVFPWILELYEQSAGEHSIAELKKAVSLVKKMTENLSR